MTKPELIVGTSHEPIEAETLADAPMFSIARGVVHCPELKPGDWDLFTNSPGFAAGEIVLERASMMGAVVALESNMPLSTCVDDDSAPRLHIEDAHAALAYIQWGGTLIKLPDNLKSDDACRWYVVIYFQPGFPRELTELALSDDIEPCPDTERCPCCKTPSNEK